ncbi:hypothetical protein [Natrinema halophilum]|uniref:Uncharacterized protein n=1 Tax=Natrinema halophilum TaxID=1699371 RepID=A0A7D5KX90_9EURY|nr:hypothetical protein [Natrinema halophilum]QLG48702.1 hypothetical protein HYG82_07505 [Natrinema halophilum]
MSNRVRRVGSPTQASPADDAPVALERGDAIRALRSHERALHSGEEGRRADMA